MLFRSSQEGSDSSDSRLEEDSESVSGDDLEGVLVAFCAMEYRRLRRIRNGRIVKDGLGISDETGLESLLSP